MSARSSFRWAHGTVVLIAVTTSLIAVAKVIPILDEVRGLGFRQVIMAPGLIFAPIGILAVWHVWRRTEPAELRLLALVGGSCTVPYMMNYDMVAMAPAAAAMLLPHRDWRVWLVGLFGFVVFWASPFIVTCGAAFLASRYDRCRVP